jgi:nickel superoxide dismutase
MHTKGLQFLGIVLFVLFLQNLAFCHCEIPCGIYDDEMRVNMLSEHVTTIEKSIKQIVRLQKEKNPNYNQIVRWVNNKENHANMLQEIVTQYFMTQRIKLDTKDYHKKLTILHHMLIYTMKCKQTTDLSHIETLRKLIKEFRDLYFK